MAKKRRLRAKNRMGIVVPFDVAAQDVTMSNGENVEEAIIKAGKQTEATEILKRNVEIVQGNIQQLYNSLANLAFLNSRTAPSPLNWNSDWHDVILRQNGLSHCSASAADKVADGGTLVVTIVPHADYTMAGVQITASATSGSVAISESGRNKIITISNITADVTITLSGSASYSPQPNTLHLSLTNCICTNHEDGDNVTVGNTINVVLETSGLYGWPAQPNIVVTGGTSSVSVSGNEATVTIVVSGNVTVTAVAEQTVTWIDDGLVFHLDGRDIGSIDGAWVDKIGGIIFKNNGSVNPELGSNNEQIGWSFPTESPKGYFAVMDGSSWNDSTDGSKVMTHIVTENGITHFIIGTANGAAIGSKQVTIEVVAKLADNMSETKSFIFMGSAQSSSATDWDAPYMDINTQSSAKRLYGNSSNHWSYNAVLGQKATISMSSDRAYANGSPLANVSFTSKHADTNEGGVFIGATRGSGYTNPTNIFSGSIYAVRIYNRVLTADEVLHNQYVDDQLYELGLNLTDVSLNNE